MKIIYNYVNGPLWTIRVEMYLYITVPIIVYIFRSLGIKKTISIIYIISILTTLVLEFLSEMYNNDIYNNIARQLSSPVSFFISGALLYYYHNNLKLLYFIIAVVALIISQIYDLYLLYPFSLSVVLIYIVFNIVYFGNWGKYGDFSYGIYIWHYPIIQTLISSRFFENSPIYFTLSVILFVIFAAYLSWTYLEKPFLRKKSHYITVEKLK